MNDAGIALYRLLPNGECWPDENEDTNLRRFMYGVSRTVEDFLNTLQTTMSEYYPGQPGMFVGDWEDQLGLPKCGQTEQPLQVRLAQILAMFRISPYSNAEFFENIADVFGFTITVMPPTTDLFEITIRVDTIEEIEFRAGWSSVDDPLYDTQTNVVLMCILNFFKHSHTHLTFTT